MFLKLAKNGCFQVMDTVLIKTRFFQAEIQLFIRSDAFDKALQFHTHTDGLIDILVEQHAQVLIIDDSGVANICAVTDHEGNRLAVFISMGCLA